ncbi:hypothetical protein MRX96_038465 [Rhipicephalus microplus]
MDGCPRNREREDGADKQLDKDVERKARAAAVRRARQQNPAVKARRAELQRLRRQNPEVRARAAESKRRRRQANADLRAKEARARQARREAHRAEEAQARQQRRKSRNKTEARRELRRSNASIRSKEPRVRQTLRESRAESAQRVGDEGLRERDALERGMRHAGLSSEEMQAVVVEMQVDRAREMGFKTTKWSTAPQQRCRQPFQTRGEQAYHAASGLSCKPVQAAETSPESVCELSRITDKSVQVRLQTFHAASQANETKTLSTSATQTEHNASVTWLIGACALLALVSMLSGVVSLSGA